VYLFDLQRSKRRPIEILVENEMTEQMNNETAQQVSEINCYSGNGDNANKITVWCVRVTVSLTRQGS
jgi:hypothetical protein